MKRSPEEIQERKRRLAEAIHIQQIENNPLTPDEIAMFEMFEREGWSDERCRSYIINLGNSQDEDVLAAE